MIHYYTDFINRPAAPILSVIIQYPGNPKKRVQADALIDTGADRTMVPQLYLDKIEAPMMGASQQVQGVGGGTIAFERAVDLIVEGRTFEALPVLGWEGNIFLLGRDVLNDFFTTLDGPSLMFSLR